MLKTWTQGHMLACQTLNQPSHGSNPAGGIVYHITQYTSKSVMTFPHVWVSNRLLSLSMTTWHLYWALLWLINLFELPSFLCLPRSSHQITFDQQFRNDSFYDLQRFVSLNPKCVCGYYIYLFLHRLLYMWISYTWFLYVVYIYVCGYYIYI